VADGALRAIAEPLRRAIPRLSNRGCEALSDAQLSEDCALPGGYLGGAYRTGWVIIPRQLAAAAEATPPAAGQR
jgi:hypothetical protein